jgi:hypothetical protein
MAYIRCWMCNGNGADCMGDFCTICNGTGCDVAATKATKVILESEKTYPVSIKIVPDDRS